MPSTASSILKTERMAAGENDDAWGDKANTVFDLHEQAIAGLESIDLAAGSVTLTDTQYVASQARKAILSFAGVTPGARTVTIPARAKTYLVKNGTGGGYRVILTTGSGATASVPNGQTRWVWCDGTNVALVDDGASGASLGTVIALSMAGR